MPIVYLRAPLRELAGGNREVQLPGATVVEVLRELERDWPKTNGWILDERGKVRRHVNVFLNGETVREDAALAPDDRLQVLPSISGGG
jgi:sulfur-carrier protein